MRKIIALVAVLIAVPAMCLAQAPGIYNGNLEEGAAGWTWSPINGVEASIRTETGNPHSGKQCLAFSSKTGVVPNVYARFMQNVAVLPEMDYEFSVWSRGTDVSVDPGAAHFTDWASYTLNLPTGTFGWTRSAITFRTGPGQRVVQIGLNIINMCGELVLDDIALRPIGAALKGDGVEGSFIAQQRVIEHDAPAYLSIYVNLSDTKQATLEATVTAGTKRLFRKSTRINPGENQIDWEWNSGRVDYGPVECTVRVLGPRGAVLASGTQKSEKVHSPISDSVDRAESRLKEFNSLYKQCQARKIPLDYPTVTKVMLEQFIPLARQDIRNDHEWRAKFAARDFERSVDEAIAEMKAYLADPSTVPNARRYTTSTTDIEGLSFIADRKDTTGKRDRGPVFFTGYGHFSKARLDIPKWPAYGINIIQSAEFGPSAVLPEENKVDLEPVKTLIKGLNDAAKHNVKLDVLISVHYFPGWAYEKWPHLGKGGGGFYGFCMDAPEAKQVIDKYLSIVLPMIKDHPALHSFCLSNEPSFERSHGCDDTRQLWTDYLKTVHGTVDNMNRVCRSSYKSFEETPMPGAWEDPLFYNWCVFLQERFAGWHKWLGDTCHKYAPRTPVHSKIRMHEVFHRPAVVWGIDPEIFGRDSEINGNDCIYVGWPGEDYSLPWQTQNMSYDLQRSLNPKPIFNSENHPTLDRSTADVQPEHFRTALWQGAVHGQGATTLWVWERSDLASHDFYGNVMDRPGCAEAVGRVNLDLNRFADEVTALQNAKSPVAILYSVASLIKDAGYLDANKAAYAALNFCGVRVDYISEKQLVAGKGARYAVIVLPGTVSVPREVFEAIRNLPSTTRLVMLGDSLTQDPYGNLYDAAEVEKIRQRALLLDAKPAARDIWPALREELDRRGALPQVSVVDANTGKPVWAVEWLPAKLDGRTIVNVVNLGKKPVEVDIRMNGRSLRNRNLLSLGGKEPVKLLKPGTPALAELEF